MSAESTPGAFRSSCARDEDHTSQEATFLAAYRRGETASLAAVNSWIRAAMRHTSLRLQEDRADIVQEVHRRLLSNLHRDQFRGESTFKTYTYRVTRNTCIDFLRRRDRHRHVELVPDRLEDPSPGPEQSMLVAERGRITAKAIRKMPEGYRQIYYLVYRDHLDYDTVRRRLGIASGTVKSRASRFRRLLTRLVAEECRTRDNASIPASSR